MQTRKLFQFNFAPYFRNVSRSTVWAMLCLALCILGLGLSATADDHKATIITFDAPGAAGTTPYSISSTGAITGSYWDASGVIHGFVRAPDGAITDFDYPGGTFTMPWAINSRGEITGLYGDPTVANWDHGFVRTPQGRFISFDAPGAGDGTGCCGSLPTSNGPGQGTMGEAINPAGWIGGDYVDSNNVMHGFLRARDGKIMDFVVPGASAYCGAWVDGAAGINPAGAIVGAYLEAPGYVDHGYVRAPDGTITVFDAPGAGTGSFQGTLPEGINSEGAIVGNYVDSGGVNHGFLRAAYGRIITFDFPGAAQISGLGTIPEDINSGGEIAGFYFDADSVGHGFVLTPNGKFIRFDAPDAVGGTFPATNNDAGAITGFYVDSEGVYHGFLRLPMP
jgi:hypothetical protein